jgi:hypothetical protein
LASSTIALRNALKKICAVRGPLTRKHLQAGGMSCPEVFGDAAIFYTALYPATRAIKYELGIVQHIREVGIVPLPRADDTLSVKFIDIGAGLTKVIDDIVSCRRIVSSSLHGIIAAHAFGVPAHFHSWCPKTTQTIHTASRSIASLIRLDFGPRTFFRA